MNDNKERVYSEEDLCEYTILQKIDELEKLGLDWKKYFVQTGPNEYT